MTDDDPFYSAKLRIARAEEHLNDLKAKIEQFFAEKPYAQVVEPDPDGIHEIHKVRFTKRFPFRWRLLATEVVEHLRASLDHATWATAYLATGDPDLKFGIFPFSNSPTNFEDRMGSFSKDVPAEIQALLRTFQPYKGGNDDLWTLNDMSNLSKHALIAFIGCATQTAGITALKNPGLGKSACTSHLFGTARKTKSHTPASSGALALITNSRSEFT